jgi:hypothetical protein
MDAIISATDQPGAGPAAPPAVAPPTAAQHRHPSLLRAALGFVVSVAATIAVMIALAAPEPRPQREASALLLRGSL